VSAAAEAMEAPRPTLKLFLAGLLAAVGVAGLTALGVWQLERRVWKLALIARVDRRVHAAPVAAPGPAELPQLTRARDEYRHVQASGRFLDDRETLVRAVTELGSGFWVLTPFRTDGGFTVLVNRGFVPPEWRDPRTRAAGETGGETVVTGLLRMSEPGGAFLHANSPADDRWYSRDVAAIAATRRLSNVVPYFIDADAAANPGGFPAGGLTVITFPNNHLVYALTWFGLALLLAGATIRVGKDEWRLRRRL
jgi:surfeit locus 1 family protein